MPPSTSSGNARTPGPTLHFAIRAPVPYAVHRPVLSGATRPAPSGALRPVAAPANTLGWAMAAWTPAARPASDPSLDHLMDAAMHGARNSLSAILLGVDLLGRRGPGQDTRDIAGVLDHIASAATRAHEQAEELADFSRMAAGRPVAVALRRFSPHATVAQAVADALSHHHEGDAIEHDRLGQGECHGDATRIAQFVRLALDEIAAPRRIVVSEVSGECFRIAVHAAGHQMPAAPNASASRLASASRRALMHGIAQAHRGSVRFGPVSGGGAASIEGRFG